MGSLLAKNQVIAPESNMVTIEDSSLPVDFEEVVVKKINEVRVSNSLGQLTQSEKLNMAARARLAVISAFDDYDGSATAITREKSMSLVGFETSIIGDVLFETKNERENFLDEVLKNETERQTLTNSKFSEIGVAKIKLQKTNLIYVMLGSEIKKTSVKAAPVVKQSVEVKWGGPELWEKVNARRVESGVGKLNRKDELCTIASIRLNQLLELNKLDGHAGFQPVLNRSDLKWISEKYNISEYLAQGFSSAAETVSGWENTLGHKSLLTGGEYVWGCVYAQNSFVVAIAAY